jgi:hypothetical protein
MLQLFFIYLGIAQPSMYIVIVQSQPVSHQPATIASVLFSISTPFNAM